MELRHLRYFVAVGNCLSFTKAAEVLGITQPALSRQIQEFEEDVGAPLFDRQGKKTALTPAGTYLLGEVEHILEVIESACGNARAIGGQSRTVKIGCASFILGTTVSDLLSEVKRRMPDLLVEILVMSTEAQERALFSGAIDIGFVRSWISRTGIAFDPVLTEALYAIYPSSLDELVHGTPTLPRIAELPFVGISRKGASRLADFIAGLREELGDSGNPVLECNDASSIPGLVQAGLGWSIVPSHDIDPGIPQGISSILLDACIDVGLAYREKSLTEPAERFLRIAKSYFASHRD